MPPLNNNSFPLTQTGRMPHAWLIGGEQGIGKATLAYRVARFVLAHPDPNSAEVHAANNLSVPSDNAVARRIVAQSHSDLLVLERTLNDAGKLRTEIAVDDVRRTVGFFGSTAGEGGWRVCIVDSAEELNRVGANTLLKILEEPPTRAIAARGEPRAGPAAADDPLALPAADVAAARRTKMSPLQPLPHSSISADDPQLQRAVSLAEGSVGRAIALYDGTLLALRERIAGSARKTARRRSAGAARTWRQPRPRRRWRDGDVHRCGSALARRSGRTRR